MAQTAACEAMTGDCLALPGAADMPASRKAFESRVAVSPSTTEALIAAGEPA